MKRFLLASCAAGALSLGAHGASAATAAAAAANNGTTVGELVVTAEKREQNLETVPVAVSAFTAAKRQLIGIDSIQDMSNFTPGLEYNSSTDRVAIRGVGRQTNVLSADASVANYADGIYESFAVQAGESDIFLDRVEILRGPQGTLYGRNAIGGAINEISRRPTKDWYAEVRGTYSNYNRFLLEGAVSGPITNNLQFRLAGNWEKQTRGWIHEVVPGVSDEGNVVNVINLDGQLQAQFSDKFEGWVRVFYQYWNNPAGGPGSQAGGWTPYPFYTSEFTPGSPVFNPGYACSGQPTVQNVVNPSPDGCTNPATKSPWLAARNEAWRVWLPYAFTIATQWVYHGPGFDVKYITGGVNYRYNLYGPAGSITNNQGGPATSYTLQEPIPGFLALNVSTDNEFVYEQAENTWSHEINILSTNNSPFQWLVGAYYFYQHFIQPVYVVTKNQPQLNGPFPAVCAGTGGVSACPDQNDMRYYDNRPDLTAKSEAVFGQIDWKFIPTLKLTLGARYSADQKAGAESTRVICFALPSCLTTPYIPGVTAYQQLQTPELYGPFTPGIDITQVGSVVSQQPAPGVVGSTIFNPATGFATRYYNAHWQAVTGTAGLEWTPNPDTLVYGKYSRGYKDGGFNIGIFTAISFYPYTAAEHVDSFEAGFKRTWGHTLTTNLAAFWYHYTNLQIPYTIVATGGGITQNNTEFYNVPDSISRGLEAEITWAPTEHLTILFDYSYDDAYIQKGALPDSVDPTAAQPGAKPLPCTNYAGGPTPCVVDAYSGGLVFNSNQAASAFGTPPGAGYCTPAFPGAPGCEVWQNLAGNRLPNAPKNKIALNAVYTWNMFSGQMAMSGSYIWRDVQYGTLFTRWYNAAPSWDEFDARLTWTSANGRVKVIGYGKNLFNSIGYDAGATGDRRAGSYDVFNGVGPGYFSQVNYVDPTTPIEKTYSVTPPRTYGIEVDYKFF
ncbi:MAG TPA: TonB-dependent receptor [Caulobacteraceae bacterium]|nr:TonB-dependent receptor [Caulobacteraceae bacterium]